MVHHHWDIKCLSVLVARKSLIMKEYAAPFFGIIVT